MAMQVPSFLSHMHPFHYCRGPSISLTPPFPCVADLSTLFKRVNLKDLIKGTIEEPKQDKKVRRYSLF
ncbi:hypothetical protein L6164_013238 [Bauhinia variegata]|uniref:Uncharacterized protein n=1 Tax=Bauhinia variegata TaxID=167791 RepID=A0ACB9PBQ3_BAUVA|nr:hypothetical protein L6164_013238 [Bauhinia variegata]